MVLRAREALLVAVGVAQWTASAGNRRCGAGRRSAAGRGDRLLRRDRLIPDGAALDQEAHRIEIGGVGRAPERRRARRVGEAAVAAAAAAYTIPGMRDQAAFGWRPSRERARSRYVASASPSAGAAETCAAATGVDGGPERRHALPAPPVDIGAALDQNIAMSNWPLMVAISSGVVASPAPGWLMLAPPSSNARAASMLPCREACSSAAAARSEPAG